MPAFVRSYAVTHAPGTVVPPQPAGWDLVLYAASGAMTVETITGRWLVPATRAVWVPSGVDHRITTTGPARVRNLYFLEGLVAMGPAPRSVQMSTLLRELVLKAVRTAPLHEAVDHHRHLVGLLAHELAASPAEPLELPMPRDPRAVAVAEALLADPGAAVDLGVLAARAGASRRTIERVFRAETHIALAAWRSRLRLLTALRLLAEGGSVEAAARSVGYGSTSAFVAMFRRELGTTPGRYLGRIGG